MRVFVKDVKSKAIISVLDVVPTRSILDIKKDIHKKTGVPPEQQRFLMELEDDHILLSYMSKAESIIEMDEKLPEKIRITVKTLEGRHLNYVMKTHDIISDLMDKITRYRGIPRADQRLIFAGQLLEENRTFFDHNIKDKSVLHLVRRLTGC